MNKALPFFVLLALVSGTSTSVADPYASVHWDSCGSYQINKDFSGPDIYRQVVRGYGFQEPITGYTIRLHLQASNVYNYPSRPLPDAWRFDPNGCQGNRLIAGAGGGGCPILGSGPRLNDVTFEESFGALDIILSVSHDLFVPSPETVYSLWVLNYDHSYSVAGPQEPGFACGDADAQVCFVIEDGDWYDAQSNPHPIRFECCWGISWQEEPGLGCFADLPVEPSTWGAIKSAYK